MNLVLALVLDTAASGFSGARFLAFRADTPFALTEEGFVLRLWGGVDTLLGPFPPPPGGLAWLGDSLLVLSGGKLFLWDTALLAGLPVEGVGLRLWQGELYAGFGEQGCVFTLLPRLRRVRCGAEGLLGFAVRRGSLYLATHQGISGPRGFHPLPDLAYPSAMVFYKGWLLALCPGDPALPPGQPPAGVWLLPRGVRLPLPVNPYDGALRGDTLYLLEDGALLRAVLKPRELMRLSRG